MLAQGTNSTTISGEHRSRAAPWCSGLTRRPVKAEIVGSNPIGVANQHSLILEGAQHWPERRTWRYLRRGVFAQMDIDASTTMPSAVIEGET